MTDHDTTATAPARPRRDRRFVLVPAVTFLVGLLLGALLVWVAGPDGAEQDGGRAGPAPGAGASPTPRPQPGPQDPAAVTVAEACRRAAEGAGTMVNLVREAVTAIGDLDAVKLQEVVDRMEGLDQQIRDDLRVCRERSG